MAQLAYRIATAAAAASVSEHAIELAIQERKLVARDLDGVQLILATDMQTWLEGIPVI